MSEEEFKEESVLDRLKRENEEEIHKIKSRKGEANLHIFDAMALVYMSGALELIEKDPEARRKLESIKDPKKQKKFVDNYYKVHVKQDSF